MLHACKVRTIPYQAAQKDTLRAPLHITITVSYKIFFSDAPSVQSMVLFLDTFAALPS